MTSFISETLSSSPIRKAAPFVAEQGGLNSAYRDCSVLGWLAQQLRLRVASSPSLDSLQKHCLCPQKAWAALCFSAESAHW